MKRILFFVAAIGVALTIVSRSNESDNDNKVRILQPDTSWVLAGENAEIIRGLYSIDGQLYVYDSIPCASAAQHRKFLWFFKIAETYIDCRTCEPASGRAIGPKGACMRVYRYPPL